MISLLVCPSHVHPFQVLIML